MNAIMKADGSLEADAATPASYDYNVAITTEVTNIAHDIGVSVEGELGCLGSLETGEGEKEDGHGFEGKLSMDQLLTDPDQAVDFVTRTKCDALAIAMGTSNGAYKFSRKPDGEILAMQDGSQFDQRKFLVPALAAMEVLCKDQFERFGTAGNAPKIKAISVADMAKRYASGALDQQIASATAA